LAIPAGESSEAAADVVIALIRAAGAIETWFGVAFVQIDLAVDAFESRIADAAITVDLVQTLGVIAARIRVTFVNILLTILAGVTRLAGAGVVPRFVGASAAIEARPRGAVVAICPLAPDTYVFIVRAIVFFVLVPDAGGQFHLSTETSEI